MYELGDVWTLDVSVYRLESLTSLASLYIHFLFFFGLVWWYPLRRNFDVARRLPNSSGDRRQ